MQRPPAYSAVKVGGRARLRAGARAARRWRREPRPVTVHRAELLWHEGERAAFEIECSAGTYVRTLIADLGDAYCEELERTAIGPFRLDDAGPERLVPLAEALAFLPERELTRAEADGGEPRPARAGAGDAAGAGAADGGRRAGRDRRAARVTSSSPS